MGAIKLASEASKIWNNFSEDEKKKYVDQSVNDKARYERQMQEFKSQGFYINEDGVKSTEFAKWADDVVLPKPAKSAYSLYFIKNI